MFVWPGYCPSYCSFDDYFVSSCGCEELSPREFVVSFASVSNAIFFYEDQNLSIFFFGANVLHKSFSFLVVSADMYFVV